MTVSLLGSEVTLAPKEPADTARVSPWCFLRHGTPGSTCENLEISLATRIDSPEVPGDGAPWAHTLSCSHRWAKSRRASRRACAPSVSRLHCPPSSPSASPGSAARTPVLRRPGAPGRPCDPGQLLGLPGRSPCNHRKCNRTHGSAGHWPSPDPHLLGPCLAGVIPGEVLAGGRWLAGSSLLLLLAGPVRALGSETLLRTEGQIRPFLCSSLCLPLHPSPPLPGPHPQRRAARGPESCLLELGVPWARSPPGPRDPVCARVRIFSRVLCPDVRPRPTVTPGLRGRWTQTCEFSFFPPPAPNPPTPIPAAGKTLRDPPDAMGLWD